MENTLITRVESQTGGLLVSITTNADGTYTITSIPVDKYGNEGQLSTRTVKTIREIGEG